MIFILCVKCCSECKQVPWEGKENSNSNLAVSLYREFIDSLQLSYQHILEQNNERNNNVDIDNEIRQQTRYKRTRAMRWGGEMGIEPAKRAPASTAAVGWITLYTASQATSAAWSHCVTKDKARHSEQSHCRKAGTYSSRVGRQPDKAWRPRNIDLNMFAYEFSLSQCQAWGRVIIQSVHHLGSDCKKLISMDPVYPTYMTFWLFFS